ncbi:glycosyl hydrolase [Chitinophaga filiformis]|uniref:glycoside hydrolase family 38 C-terminal domain-containing protein n=1 Tax=Chitinophaga filiformis TaxID=104663 RepID=UPI001F47D567|nr:glycoside hydrolase family 38 C-terminal domain-containing protein [Chitinophaga filiformis]MCF6403155.1 glycosyl hydrolase [Chitinophaga filiformis]
MKHTILCLAVLCTVGVGQSIAQQHYFIDGYHGGKYGHYPPGYTQYIVEQLQAHPEWKINLEIEPETWDVAKVEEPAAYARLQQLFADQSDAGRIEYVNPGYGQSYLYTGSGESMIRQFSYGMQHVRQHFPGAVFSTYSSEEPCFTSALPQVLLSFGFKYAALKNPNTCWGGYTRAFGGEVVQWQGPDGSIIPTVPRYGVEALLPNSTWQTTAWNNSSEYIQSALAAGIRQPIGMCLQDAGWRNGPWLKQQAKYETWRHYIGHVADTQHAAVWAFNQEDVQVSLVWGAQALQRIAQQVRQAENKLAVAEKYAAISSLVQHLPWPKADLDSAWKTLLLSQHHDCWIVPYNGSNGDTWIDKVQDWTDNTLRVSDSILLQGTETDRALRVLNTTATAREEWVVVPAYRGASAKVTDNKGKAVKAYIQRDSSLIFKASVAPMGFNVYHISEGAKTGAGPTRNRQLADGRYQIETDQYRMIIDPARGGVITSLIAKQLNNREMVDRNHSRSFNELRGYFYQQSAWRSSTDTAAAVRLKEDNPARTVVEIKGAIGGHPFTQLITLANAASRIDMQLKIDWQGEPGIGAPPAKHYRVEDYHKAFYNDSFKLQVLLPLNLAQQQLSKDAPYDVTESRLTNTFFSSWDSIKNNVLLHWADVTDGKTGLALFADHTTSYVHGENYPLGFTVQFTGTALWGRNYNVTGPTDIHYAILPHSGAWDKGGVSEEATRWCEPLKLLPAASEAAFSLLSVADQRWQIPAMMMDGDDLLIRVYNAAGDNREHTLSVTGTAAAAIMERLDGQSLETLPAAQQEGKTIIRLAIPRFGIRTIRLKNINIQH